MLIPMQIIENEDAYPPSPHFFLVNCILRKKPAAVVEVWVGGRTWDFYRTVLKA
jgi:hypothetical protein